MSTKLGVTENFVSSLYLLIQSSTLKKCIEHCLTALATLLHVNSRLSNPPNVGRLEINIVLCHLNSDRSESSFRVIVFKLENIDQDAKRKPLLIEQETE